MDPLAHLIDWTGGVRRYAEATRWELLMERLADLTLATPEMLEELAKSGLMERMIEVGRASPDAMRQLKKTWICRSNCFKRVGKTGRLMDYKIQRRKAFSVMGIHIRTVNAPGKAEIDIPTLLSRFFEEKVPNKIPDKRSKDIYALYTDYEEDHTKPYSLTIGFQVPEGTELVEGLVVKNVPEATYAMIISNGKFPEHLLKTWEEIWESDLERSYIADFEIFGTEFHPTFHSEIELYVGLKV